MLAELRELWRYRELLLVMIQRDLKIRYKNSALGFFWSFLNPLLTVSVMTFVYGQFIFKDQPNMGAYIMAAYLPFMFFQMCLMDSAQSIIAALPLIKKIYFPREILPLAAVFSNFVNFLLALGIFFLYLLINYALHPGSFPIQGSVWIVPILLIFSLCLSAGVSLIISALNTFYEDIKYIVGVVLYLLFFLCPIVYFDETVANSKINVASNWLVYKLYNLNPIAQLCTAYKKSILAPYNPTLMEPQGATAGQSVVVGSIDLSWKYLAVAGLTSILTLIIGYHIFNRLKWRFVERP
ncbi:MAG TPA: ABC transporter permease [Fimbriimonadaceae bacterium]|nr:ABC transporter permease [Fimbriimonadaceae bacterium]